MMRHLRSATAQKWDQVALFNCFNNSNNNNTNNLSNNNDDDN